MTQSRRDFVTTGLAGVASLYVTPRSFQAAAALAPEDGYRLWLRYAPPGDAARGYREAIRHLHVEGTSPTAEVIRNELRTALSSMLGAAPPLQPALADASLIVGTPASSKAIGALGWKDELAKLGPEGFIIRTTRLEKHAVIAIASDGEVGSLYGVFHFLRLLQSGQPLTRLSIREQPRVQLRMLNHWDNMDGSIERGYAGRSLWRWSELPGTDRSQICGLCPRKCVHRDQRDGD